LSCFLSYKGRYKIISAYFYNVNFLKSTVVYSWYQIWYPIHKRSFVIFIYIFLSFKEWKFFKSSHQTSFF
jgi:hypothetical protein